MNLSLPHLILGEKQLFSELKRNFDQPKAGSSLRRRSDPGSKTESLKELNCRIGKINRTPNGRMVSSDILTKKLVEAPFGS